MPNDPKSGPTSFCQRSSIQIAADVGAAAIKTLVPLEWLQVYAHHVAVGGKGLGSLQECDKLIRETREELIEELQALGSMFDQVAPWWVADTPPALDVTSTSVIEVLLDAGCRVLAWLDVPGFVHVEPRCRLADKKWQRYSISTLDAAVRCEVAQMARRAAPSADWWALWATVAPNEGLAYFANKKFSAESAVSSALPVGWRDMPEADREAAINSDRPSPAPVARRTGVPRWVSETKTLRYQGTTIRSYKGTKPAHNQWKILDALEHSGWPARVTVGWEGMTSKTLGDTLDGLNQGLKPGSIRFARDGSGAGVTWTNFQKMR